MGLSWGLGTHHGCRLVMSYRAVGSEPRFCCQEVSVASALQASTQGEGCYEGGEDRGGRKVGGDCSGLSPDPLGTLCLPLS